MKKVTPQELSEAFNQAIEQTPGSEQFYAVKPWDELSDEEKALMAEGAWKLNLVVSEMTDD
jgi:hypothetical protein